MTRSVAPDIDMRHLLLAALFSLLWTPTSLLAAGSCCVCTPAGTTANVCLSTTAGENGPNCASLPGKYAKLKGYTCVATASDSNCAPPGSASSVCNEGPVSIAAYIPKTGNETEPTTSIPVTVPRLGVPIPGLELSSNVVEKGGYIYIPFFAQYVSGVYRYLIGLSAIAAAIMIVYGGFLYIFGATGAKIKGAKDIIVDALIGLALVLGAYTILATINPDTLSFQALRLQTIRAEPWKGDEEGDLPENIQGQIRSMPIPITGPALPPGTSLPTTGSFVLPKAICKAETCKDLCNGCSPRPDLPSAPGIATTAELVAIPKAMGLDGKGSLRKEAADALVLAGYAAATWPGGPYTIKILDSSRPLSGQVALACGKYCKGLDSEVGINVATPGGSVHGSGLAVDIELWKDKTKLVACCSVAHQTRDTKEENAKLLQDIMGSVGWVRYCKEVWHFEWGTDSIPSRSKTCAWPPN